MQNRISPVSDKVTERSPSLYFRAFCRILLKILDRAGRFNRRMTGCSLMDREGEIPFYVISPWKSSRLSSKTLRMSKASSSIFPAERATV